MSVNHSVYKCGFRITKKWLINLTNSVCMTAKNMTNFRPWRRECDNNTFIAIFMSVASRILQILWPNQLSTFWQCTENSICGTLIGCCCQNFSPKHFALANMVMLQRDTGWIIARNLGQVTEVVSKHLISFCKTLNNFVEECKLDANTRFKFLHSRLKWHEVSTLTLRI